MSPNTRVAFEIRYPWRAYPNPRSEWERDYRHPFITIWHRDPERRGDDDSCDWAWWHNLTEKEKVWANSLIDNEVDNLRSFFSQFVPVPCDKHSNWEDCYAANCRLGDFVPICDLDMMKARVRRIVSIYKKKTKWRYPVRWHFWHWQIQIHPLEAFKRWAFSRCSKCKRRFAWGYSPCTNLWNNRGPRWFRSELNVFHEDCNNPTSNCSAQASTNEGVK